MFENEQKNIEDQNLDGKKLFLQQGEFDKPPKDRYFFVYLTFLLHGIGILLPWNVFLTISYDVNLIKIFYNFFIFFFFSIF